jgi:prolyl oligopeptidase
MGSVEGFAMSRPAFQLTPYLLAAVAAMGEILAMDSRTVLAAPPAYPPAPVHVVADTLGGRAIGDPYRWLEDDASPEVRQWTDAENALTRGILDAFPGRSALGERLKRLYALPVTERPQVCGSRVFFSRRDGTQNQPVVCLREGGGTGPPRTVLDPNLLSADGTVALDWMYPSPDGSLIAYGTSSSGSEQSTLRVRDVAGGRDLGDEIPHTQFATLVWDADGRGFLYTRHPAAGEVPAGEEVFHARLYHHRLGADSARDSLVFGGEGRPIQEFRSVYRSSDRSLVFFRTSLDWTKNDLYFKPAGSSAEFAPLAVGLDGRVNADAWRGRLYLLTDAGAPRYHLVTADPAAPDPARWTEIIPEQSGVIEDFQLAGGRIAAVVSENAVSRLLLFGLDGTLEREIPLPAPGEVSNLAGEPDGDALYFVFTSFVHPPAVYRYGFRKGTLEPIERGDAGPRASDYETTQEWATSKDGTRVPYFVVRRKDAPRDGGRPTLLEGYGGFGVSEKPAFQAAILPWLDAGGVFVDACLRGGGEFGRAWHEAGRRERKQNVFDDYFAVAEALVSRGLTRPDRLAARGGSNGGLLVGAALTQRPELFGAVVCQAPLLDMLRYQRFSIARYWIPEYGSAENAADLDFLLAYSPYHHVKAGVRYPATLLTTADSDTRVAPLHARKMTALLQASSAGDAPILLRTETRAGHGQGKPTAKRIAEGVDLLSFLMLRFGMSPG